MRGSENNSRFTDNNKLCGAFVLAMVMHFTGTLEVCLSVCMCVFFFDLFYCLSNFSRIPGLGRAFDLLLN